MHAGERYGIPRNMQPFEASRGSPHLFCQSQIIPCISQVRSNVSLLREHVPWLHLPAPPPPPHLYQGQLQEPVNQALGVQHQHFLGVHPPISQQLPPHSHSSEIPTSIAAVPSTIQLKQFVAEPLGGDGFQTAVDRAAGFNRWTREDSTTLERLRSEMNASFRDSGLKESLWEEDSRKLQEMGYHGSATTCSEKFENVQKYYKGTDGMNCRMQGVCIENSKGDDHLGGDSEDSSCGGLGCTGQGRRADTSERGRGCAPTTDGVLVRKPDTTYNAVNLSSDSSEAEHGWSNDVDEQDSRKTRKRKRSSSPSRAFFETFARQILKHQEELHRSFLQTIEKRELERIAQEEAYRRKEIARLNKEQDLRAQDLAATAARDAALLEFLEKASSQAFQLPKMPTQTTISIPAVSDVQVDANEKLAGGTENNTKRWLKVEVRALIRLRSGMDPRFQEAGPKAHLWQEIAASMTSMGFIRSPKRCKEKWENINKYFKKTKGSCRKRPENAKTCPYFHQLDTLYRRGILPSSSGKFNRLDNLSAENLLENNAENDVVCRNESSLADVVAVIPARRSGPDSAQETNSTALKFHSETERNSKADSVAVQASQSKLHSDSFTSLHPTVPRSQQVDRLLAVEGTSISKSSTQMEIFIKDIIELQQQQHQRLVDEYEKLRQPQDLRHFEIQHTTQSVPASAHEQSHTNTAGDTNADLLALVHKFAADSCDLAMSARSNME